MLSRKTHRRHDQHSVENTVNTSAWGAYPSSKELAAVFQEHENARVLGGTNRLASADSKRSKSYAASATNRKESRDFQQEVTVDRGQIRRAVREVGRLCAALEGATCRSVSNLRQR